MHTYNTDHCLRFFYWSVSFRGSCMCRPFVKTLRRPSKNVAKPMPVFLSHRSGALPPGSLCLDQFSSVHRCTSILCIASLPSSRVALLISLILQKAICFMLSTLRILARVWKETFTNYVEPTTRIPEIAITEEISKVE